MLETTSNHNSNPIMLRSYKYNKGCDGFHISCTAMPSQIPRRFLSEEYQSYLFPMLNMLEMSIV